MRRAWSAPDRCGRAVAASSPTFFLRRRAADSEPDMTMNTKQNPVLDDGQVIDDVAAFICGTMLIDAPGQTLDPAESLVQRGVIDSTGVLELVGFLEQRYGIRVDDEEITTDNLDSLTAIAAYLRRKLG
jgi:acyl carrier protein